MSTRKVIRSISNFLFSRANRELLIFLFFFIIAGIFWLLTSLNETYEEEVKIVAQYVNVPKNVVLTSPETDTLRVNVSDRGINLVGYVYSQNRHVVKIDYARYTHGNGNGIVSGSDLQKLVVKELPTSAKLISIKPDKLTFHYNNGERKRVPVRIRGQIVPEKIYFISDTIIKPDSITIYASKEKLDSINYIYTEPLNYSNFQDTLKLTTRLQSLAEVKVVPSTVELCFATDILTEEFIDNIPIVGINMPEGKRLRTFPAKITVYFVTGMKNYQGLKPDDFKVVADYNEFSNSTLPKCNIYLRDLPPNISRARLNTTQVDYLIEEKTAP